MIRKKCTSVETVIVVLGVIFCILTVTSLEIGI